MQCVNCGFQNMPGSEACGRCGTSLLIGAAVMDVHPPRAGLTAKRLRRALPIRKAFYRTRDALHGDEMAVRARHAAQTLPPFPLFIRLIFPGWSHFYLKQRVRGHLFMWGFLFCLLPTLLLFGSFWGSIWLGLAFSVHSSAALDIVTQTFADAGTRDRIARSFVVSFVLGVCPYLPIYLLVSTVAQPHTVVTPIAPFHAGDVILTIQRKNLKRGDVVMYELNYQRSPTGRFGGEAYYSRYEGELIDRILAMPGDKVECRAGILFVNGSRSSALPLNAGKMPSNLVLTVPPGLYLILPSGAPGIGSMADPGLWTGAGLVIRSQITGRAYLQTSPLSHLHFIH